MSSSRSAPIKRHPPAVRRQLLLDAARSVIAAHGLHATSLRDVAAAGGVSLGTVTYHFAGIEEVLAGVLEDEMSAYSAPVFARARAARTGYDGLRKLVDGLLASTDRADQHWKLWLDFWAMSARHPRYSVWQARVYEELHALTATLLRRGIADGTLRVADADRQAVELIAMLDGLVVQAYLPDTRLSPAGARDLLRAYVNSSLAVSRPAAAH